MKKAKWILSAVALTLCIAPAQVSFAQNELPPGIPKDDPRRTAVRGGQPIIATTDATPVAGTAQGFYVPSLDELEAQIRASDQHARASASQPPVNGGLDPSQSLSAADVTRMAAKQQSALIGLNRMTRGVSTMEYPGYWQWVSTGYDGQFREPEDAAYVNYCGPSATQVALRARLADAQIPSLYTVGQEEGIDPAWGVYMTSVRDVLNVRLSTTWYEASSSGNSDNFISRVSADLSGGYAMVTALQTSGLSGWNEVNADHIVAVHAMYVGDGSYSIAWVDTASNFSRHNQVGPYYNSMPLGRAFYDGYVKRNDYQAW